MNAADDDFRNQLALTADEQFASGNHTLIFADIEHYKIPFGIHHENFAVQVGAQFDVFFRPDVFGEFVGQATDGVEQDHFFTVNNFHFGAGGLEVFAQLENLFRRQLGRLVSGEGILRVITILRDLGKFVRKASGQLGLLVGASHLLIAVSLRVGQILFRLRQIVFRLGEFRLGFGKVAERGDFGGMFVVALLGERGNLVGHFEIRNHASTEAGQNGNN